MSRYVWTSISIASELEERTWIALSEVAADTDRVVYGWRGVRLAVPRTGLKFEFATDAQAIAFRLTHPDHLLDQPATEGVHWSPIVDVLNRLPRLTQ
jgi:hypothetical protein